MKLQSNIWKKRTIHLPNASNTFFDENGICTLDITKEEANYLINNIKDLVVIDDNIANAYKKEKVNKEEVLNGKSNLENQIQIENNIKNLENSKDNSEEEKLKKEAINKINAIKSVQTLKKLASDFDKNEWINLRTIEEFKSYLINKI